MKFSRSKQGLHQVMDTKRQREEPSGRRPVILVGGKGGVGKTTCAASLAVRLSTSGHRTLLITSDMTPSLSDILDHKIGDTITAVTEHLDAYEISQDAVVAWWRRRFGRDFAEILDHIVDVEALDSESRHQLLDYIGSAPSLREETMLDVIRSLAETGGYARIVWDTAPAGETMNLLDMPRTIRKHLHAGAKVFEGLDRLGKQLVGKRSIGGIMDEWGRASDEISRFLHERSLFVIVANPEALVVSQVRRMLAMLRDYRIAVRGLVINRAIADPDSSSLSVLYERQQQYIEELRILAGDLRIATVPLLYSDIRGVDRLREIGETLVEGLRLEEPTH